MQQFSDI